MANSGDGDSKVREPQRSHYYKVFRYGENGAAEEHYLEVLRDDRRRARTTCERLAPHTGSRLADRIRAFNRRAAEEQGRQRLKQSSDAAQLQANSRVKCRGNRRTRSETSPGAHHHDQNESVGGEPVANGCYTERRYLLDTRRHSTDRCHARLSIEMSVTDPAVVPVQNQLLLSALQALFIPSCPGICIERVHSLQDIVSRAVTSCEVRPTFWCRSYEKCKVALFLSSEAKKKVKHERQFLLRALRCILQTTDIAVFIDV